jgi:hypothetical protein
MHRPGIVLAAEDRRTIEETFTSRQTLADTLTLPAVWLGRLISREIPPLIQSVEGTVSTARHIGHTLFNATRH